MASIVQKRGKYYVVYSYKTDSGEKKQKWEPCKTEADAKRKQKEIEYKINLGVVAAPKCKTVTDLLDEYVSLYGKSKWSLSVYSANNSLISNYITPFIGKMLIADVSPRVLERYYQKLLQTEAVPRKSDAKFKKDKRMVGTSTVRDVHKLLKSAFTQAVKWEIIDRNPVILAEVPKHVSKKREIWDLDTLAKVNEVCPDPLLKLSINLSFACSLRMGELLGLTWDCVDITEESINAEKAFVFINKELQRVSKEALNELENKDVIATFPELMSNCKTQVVLKKPKTPTSVRKVYLPKSVAEMLQERKKELDKTKEMLGDEYHDYSLVICGQLGTPVEHRRIEKAFKDFIKNYDLPDVVFHSLRHSSITYKLRLTGGDIKAVQGDSGHAQATMVTDQYSHILDESRKENAKLLENAFYQGKNAAADKHDEPKNADSDNGSDSVNAETVQEILSNPEMVQLLIKLSKGIGNGDTT